MARGWLLGMEQDIKAFPQPTNPAAHAFYGEGSCMYQEHRMYVFIL